MNLVQLIKYIEAIALEHPLVKSFYEGSVYEHLNSKDVKYGVFVLTQPDFNSVVKDDNVKRYIFQATYVDRLCEDESNRLCIQTDGLNVIHEIFNYIKTNSETADVEIPITFTTFTQRFSDKCGGAYATITLEIDDETGDCDFYYEDILIEPIPGTSHTTVLDNYYTKVEVEDLIAGVEAGVMTNYYTKNQTDNKYETIENVDLLEDIVTENTEAIENLQSGKADKADTLEGYGITDAYTKTEVDELINLKYFEIDNTILSQALLPNTAYKFTNRTNDLVLTLSPITDTTILNVYYFIINTGDTLPSITWPNGLIWYEDTEPTIAINKHYEFSIIDNVVKYYEV